MSKETAIPFHNTFTELGLDFFTPTKPEPVLNPTLISYNQDLSSELKINHQKKSKKELAELFSGSTVPENAAPIAMVYAGHQFGHFVPQLGDGRAILLGEVTDANNEQRDIQLKGAGQTKYSRSGDGKSPIGPVIREYLVSEAMHALGIPTTRALAAVQTHETVYREHPLPGAVLTRIAKSHIRIGTFQYFAARQQTEQIQTLADYCIQRLYPHLKNSKAPYLSFFKAVIEHQTKLIAQWMSMGFIHGVMNTDNCSISGETIDYGPCAFMEAFNPNQVFSYIDTQGRYAYGNQPEILKWNLTRLAECLLPLFNENQEKSVNLAQETLDEFDTIFQNNFTQIMLKKIGISSPQKNDIKLFDTYLNLLSKSQSDFTLSFRYLSYQIQEKKLPKELPTLPLLDHPEFHNWKREWLDRLNGEAIPIQLIAKKLDQVNPLYIPRNHLVEKAIQESLESETHDVMIRLNTVWKKPFSFQKGTEDLLFPANETNQVTQTFCGT